MAEEIPLTGGNSADQVIRIGDTVRKPPTPFDNATTALLNQLEAAGVTGVPRSLGTDDTGRRILSWVEGSTAFPATLWTDDRPLLTAAKHLRRVHDASTSLLDQDLNWAHSDPTKQDVICHHDFAPYNMTFDTDGSVIGIIDFDLAGPGPRLRDLSYLHGGWCHWGWKTQPWRQQPMMTSPQDQPA